MIRAILAHDENWGIGRNGQLPWPHNPADLAWFKQNTLNSTVVMGRKTFESLSSNPLPRRHNVIVSNTINTDTVEIVRTDIYKSRIAIINTTGDVWIIGGAQLINNSLDILDEIWLNNVGKDYNCDTFLPQENITTHFDIGSTELTSFGTITKWIKKS